jgi:hypothetical protein
MRSAQEAIETYVRAKDGNRPHLLARAFAADATLEMIVPPGTISFPPWTSGLEPIADVLVRRFAQTYENVHTFCLAPPPREDDDDFSCAWLVGMSEKDQGVVRVGCGRYDWRFRSRARRLVARLRITVQRMESLAPMRLRSVMDWLAGLPYPWCSVATALRAAPPLEELQPIRNALADRSA